MIDQRLGFRESGKVRFDETPKVRAGLAVARETHELPSRIQKPVRLRSRLCSTSAWRAGQDFPRSRSYKNDRAIRKTRRFQPVQEHTALGVRYNHVSKRFVFAVAIGLAVVGFVSADDNVRAVQPQHLTILAGRDTRSYGA